MVAKEGYLKWYEKQTTIKFKQMKKKKLKSEFYHPQKVTSKIRHVYFSY